MKKLLARLLVKLPIGSGEDQGMQRVLGPIDLIFLGIGAIVGTGIFVLTGHVAAQHTGPAITLAFVIAGCAATLAGLCYAEIACMVPVAGSAYSYAYASLGEIVAWVIGWDLLLEYLLAAAATSVSWSAYMGAFLEHTLGWHVPERFAAAPLTWDVQASTFVRTGAWLNVPAVLVVAVLTTLLILGTRRAARFNAITVTLKVGVILLFVACAGGSIQTGHYEPYIPPNTGKFGLFGWSGVLQGASIIFFCFNGFDAVSTAAQETRRPSRDLPIGILGSLLVAGLLYVAVAAVLTGVAPYTELAVPHPVSVALSYAGVNWLRPYVEAGAIAGLTSVILVNLMSQPRIVFSMAQHGLLPPVLGRVHARWGTPYVATLAGGSMCAVMSGLLPIDVLGELMCVGTLFAFTMVSLGVLVLRIYRPDTPRPFRVPGGAFGVPALSVLMCGGLLGMAQVHTLGRFALWVLAGLVLYFAYGYRNSRCATSTS